MSKQNGNKGRRFDRAFKEEAVRLLQTSGRRLSLPFIPSIAETLEFCITTGYPFRHA